MTKQLVLRPSRTVFMLFALGVTFGVAQPSGVTHLPAQVVEVYYYDFENGTDDWELEPGIWSRVRVNGGHALRGEGHGFARLVAHSGDVSSLRFRFHLRDMQSRLHANVLESFAPDHTRYFVSFGIEGVRISRQQGASFQDLGLGFVTIAPRTTYEAQVMVGGGSIDVFVDGEGVVGVDNPGPPPPGYVSFESLDNAVVYVDDVEVRIGPESAPHPRAPRPPLTLPPGPDVGPFVRGVHTGPIYLTGNTVLTLSHGRYTVTEGDIHLSGKARLHIEEGAVLVFDRGHSPLIHSGLNLTDAAVLEVDGGNIVPDSGALVRVNAFGASSVIVRNARLWIHFVNTGDSATMSVIDSRLVTDFAGSIQLGGKASAHILNSKLGAIGLFIPAGSTFTAKGLHTGTFADFDLQRDLKVTGIGYNLKMQNVELVRDALGDGPYERSWVIFADEAATIRINDSVLRKIIVQFPTSGDDLALKGLRLNQPTNLTVGGVVISNVTVTGQWGFFLHGSRRATFDDCDGLWFFLYDNAKVLLRNSTMNEFDPRNYTGTLIFENSEWKMAGEIIEGNDFLMAGTVKIDPILRQTLSWSQSAVARRYRILVLYPDGEPAPGVTVTLTRGEQVVTAITGPEGEASVELRFTDQDYLQPWQLTTSLDYPPLSVDFFTSAPIVVSPLVLALNSTRFRPGHTLSLTATVSPMGTPQTVDVYVAVRLPDGTYLFMQDDGSFTNQVWPVVRNWTRTAFSGQIFRYTFSGEEPVGTYAWLAAFTEPGTLNLVGPIAQAPFTFGP